MEELDLEDREGYEVGVGYGQISQKDTVSC